MFEGLEFWWLFPAAVILDAFVGDPPLFWRHPVCWIGSWLNFLERWARSKGETRFIGAICALLAICTTGTCVFVLTSLPILGSAFALYFAYAGLSAKALYKSGESVLKTLEEGSLQEGQMALSTLVSRDTTALDAQALRKTLADTLSENLTDAVIAPLFWLVLGGPVGLWMYKAVSTMDSMWGYKTPKWLFLGWAGARLDDILAYIPARLGAFFFAAICWWNAIFFQFGGRWPSFAVIASQAKGMESPNSGWPMAAAAWAFGARLGGSAIYFGENVEKPWLGPEEEHAKLWNAQRIGSLNKMVFLSSFLCASIFYCTGIFAKFFVK